MFVRRKYALAFPSAQYRIDLQYTYVEMCWIKKGRQLPGPIKEVIELSEVAAAVFSIQINGRYHHQAAYGVKGNVCQRVIIHVTGV